MAPDSAASSDYTHIEQSRRMVFVLVSFFQPIKVIYWKSLVFNRKATRIFLNGFERPDSGSQVDIMSKQFAIQNGYKIDRSQASTFELGNGKRIQSAGRVLLPCSLVGDETSFEAVCFHILETCMAPIILGMDFIKKTSLLKTKRHLLVDCPKSWFGELPALKFIGRLKSQISFSAEGQHLTGCADSGSDLDIMSLSCVMRSRFDFNGEQENRTQIQLADGSDVETVRKIHISSLEIKGLGHHAIDFHVLPGLSCDVVFSEAYLDATDAFNTCAKIVETPGSSFVGLNILINLGPIQRFINRCIKHPLKQAEPGKQQQQQHEAELEAERYRQRLRSLEVKRIGDPGQVIIAKEAESERRKQFDERHKSCPYCILRYQNGSSRTRLSQHP
ncbi:hypothetical protein B0O99DRAFT_597576 [Bisporella sp. PMI_857]|nr:hypothetical protein B0O99DRAFT_597576 [Bisporella sp. PMI_857]